MFSIFSFLQLILSSYFVFSVLKSENANIHAKWRWQCKRSKNVKARKRRWVWIMYNFHILIIFLHEQRHFTAFPRCFDTHAFSNHFTSFDFISISFHYVRSFVSPRFQTFFYIFCSNDFHVYLLRFTWFLICLFANINLISFTFCFKLYFIFSKMRFSEFSALFCHIRIKYKGGFALIFHTTVNAYSNNFYDYHCVVWFLHIIFTAFFIIIFPF